MSIQKFERELDESSKKTLEYCQRHLTKLTDLQRELLHLSTVLGLGAGQADQNWDRLCSLFKNYLHVRNVHSISFEMGCELKSFGDSRPKTISNEDGSILFCRRSVGAIDIIDNKDIMDRLAAQNTLLVKCVGKCSFIYIEFEADQTLFQFDNIQASLEILQLLFSVFEEENKYEIPTILFKICAELTQNAKTIIQKILNFNGKLEIDGGSVIVQGKPILSLLLSRLYSLALDQIQFYQGIVFRNRISKREGQRCIFKDGKILYAFNLNSLSYENMQTLQKITLQDILSHVNLSGKIIANIMEKCDQEGNHFSNCKNWNLLINKRINFIEIVINNRRVTRKVDINECQIMKDLMSQGLKNLQSTIGNEFIPEIEDQSKKSVIKISSKRVTSFLKSGLGKSMKIEFNESLEDVLKLRKMQFNVFDYSVNSTCNLVKTLFLDRFSEMTFSQEKLQNFISKVAYSYEKRSNPFHNMYHGFTVLHGAYILSLNKFFQSVFNTNAVLAFLVSALCHDLSHTGFTNSYEEKIESKLANRYGDRSILEYNSIAKALKLFSRQETNFLMDIPNAEWKVFRRILVSSILATDNKHHTIVLSQFDAIVSEEKGSEFSQDSIEKLLGALLHCCDFWGNVKPYPISKLWSEKVNRQFSNQYKKELEAGVQPTPYFKDLDNLQVVAKNENVFISAIVYPLYKKIDQWMEGYLEPCLATLDRNLRLWKRLEEGHQQESINSLIQ